MSRFITTHQIAGLLGVSERTVANWIDRGHLEAFRTPGGHRRVSPADLVRFLQSRNMPVPPELAEETRILIVEDDPIVAQTLKGHLEVGDGAYDLTTLGDGVSALIHIGNRKPHLVLLDIMMPGMDGLEVCRKIRDNNDLKSVQVVFVTGRSDLNRGDVIRETGAAEVLFKPIAGAALRETVQRVLGDRQAIPR